MDTGSNSLLCAKWLKYLIFIVTALIYIRVCSAMLIKTDELMHAILCEAL
jgi:hypothetical protein